mgnify:CR=1 FL=1
MVEHTMTKETLENRLTALCGKEISACSEKELYTGLSGPGNGKGQRVQSGKEKTVLYLR